MDKQKAGDRPGSVEKVLVLFFNQTNLYLYKARHVLCDFRVFQIEPQVTLTRNSEAVDLSAHTVQPQGFSDFHLTI